MKQGDKNVFYHYKMTHFTFKKLGCLTLQQVSKVVAYLHMPALLAL